MRKAKRAPLTPTVVEDLQREAAKAGIPVAEAVRIAALKGWQGFNAGWDWKQYASTAAQAAPQRGVGSHSAEDILRAQGLIQ